MPILLDAFCGAGGAGMGYALAGWDVVGVDIRPQANYPFDMFIGDAIEFIKGTGHRFDAIHASPPCQASSALTKGTNAERWRYPQLIGRTRQALKQAGVPWVIENVAGAPIRKDLELCGEMFGLAVIRHRYFEFDDPARAVPRAHPAHRGRVSGYRHGRRYDGPYVAVYGDGGGKGSVPEWQAAMGIDWTDVRREIAEAIPPAYTQYVGNGLMNSLTRAH